MKKQLNEKLFHLYANVLLFTLSIFFLFLRDMSQRGCLFPQELPEEFGGRYKRSDCVVNCRVASIISLCNCLVFYLPLTNLAFLEDGITQIPTCTLEHVPCLNRYRSKLMMCSCMRLELYIEIIYFGLKYGFIV